MPDFSLIAKVTGGIVAGLFLAWVVWRIIRRRSRVTPVERARDDFLALRPRLQAAFFARAAASGRPRGLRWKQCDFDEQVFFVRDRGTQNLAALVGVTISFEAIPGGPMEDVPAVGNLRSATALFVHTPQGWRTEGRALFNMEPQDAIARPEWQLEAIPDDQQKEKP
jgi:hypothetical protein